MVLTEAASAHQRCGSFAKKILGRGGGRCSGKSLQHCTVRASRSFVSVPPPFAQACTCPSTEWALPLFSGFFRTAFFVVLNAGLGVFDALVEGKKGSFIISVIVHSVHNNIVPHVATPCGLF